MKSFAADISRLVTLFGIVCLAYSASIHGDFQFDDYPRIVKSAGIKNPLQDLKITSLQAFLNGNRPVTAFTFALNYLGGRLDPFGYHLVNLGIHLAVVMLLYIFSCKVLRLSGYKAPHYLALVMAGVFGLHPLNSQAVSYIVQRGESLASLFYILSLLLFIAAVGQGRSVKGLVFYLFGFAAFVAGIGSKEIVVTLPLAYILFDYYFLAKKGSYEKDRWGKTMYYLKRLAVPLPFIVAGAVFSVKKLKEFVGHVDIGFNLEGLDWASYLLTEFKVLATYLRLIILPVNQNLDYDYPLSRGFFEPQTLFSFLLLFFLFIVAVYLLFSLKRRASSLEVTETASPGLVVSFGICWFFLLLAPTSTVVPIIDVIFEHRAYLASWGIIAALVVTVDSIIRIFNVDNLRRRVIAVSAIAVVMVSMTLMLHKRAGVWKDNISLWSDVVKKSPYKARAYLNLGHALFLEKGCLAAWPVLNKGLPLAGLKSTVKVDILNNLAICSMEFGQNDKALVYAKRAEIMASEAGDVKNTLGEIYLANGDYAKASEYFIAAIAIESSASRYYNAALALEGGGDQGLACIYWKKYIDLEVGGVSAREVLEHMRDKRCS